MKNKLKQVITLQVYFSIEQLKGFQTTGEAHVRSDWLSNEYYGHFVNPTNKKWTSKRSIIINSPHCFDNNNTYLRQQVSFIFRPLLLKQKRIKSSRLSHYFRNFQCAVKVTFQLFLCTDFYSVGLSIFFLFFKTIGISLNTSTVKLENVQFYQSDYYYF